MERNRVRPFVIFDLFFEHYCVFAQLVNAGQTAARDVSIEVNPLIRIISEREHIAQEEASFAEAMKETDSQPSAAADASAGDPST